MDAAASLLKTDDAVDVAKTTEQLTEMATNAEKTVGGSGAVAGTKKHTDFARQVKASGDNSLKSEPSYKDGGPVNRGTLGSKRPDVLQYDRSGKPVTAYELKTGNAAGVSLKRIAELRKATGNESLVVVEVRPQTPK